MHARKGVIDYIVLLLAEVHGVDLIPDLLDLSAGRYFFALLFDVFLIEFDRGHIDAYLALGLFLGKAVVDVADIGGVNVAAASAALYVFDGRLAEESDPLASFQRQSAADIFEQHHALARGLP